MGTKVRRHLMVGILSAVAVLMVFFIPVFAEDEEVPYSIWIGPQQITSKVTSGNGWSYKGDDKGGTLTINNIRGPGYNQWHNNLLSDIPLTIVLEGSNVFNASDHPYSIYCSSDLTIKGDGMLYVKAQRGAILCQGSMTIEGARLTCISDENTLELSSYKTTNLTIKDNSDVKITGGLYGVAANEVNIINSTVNFEGNGKAVSAAYLLIDKSTINATSNNGIYVRNIEIKDGSNVTSTSKGAAFEFENMTVSGGNVTAESTNSAGVAFSKSLNITGGTTRIKGTTAIDSKSSGKITLDPSMGIKIPENGSVTENGQNIVDIEENAAAEVLLTRQYNVKIKNDDPGLISLDKENAFEGQTVTVSAKTHETGLYVLEGLTVKDGSGKKLDLTDLGNGKYSFTMPASNVSVRPVYDEATTYPILIEDISLHSRYTSGDGWSYDGDEKGGTLTLDNADLSGNTYAIRSEVPLTIVLNGENKITSKSDGIFAQSSLEIKGNGSLSLTAVMGILSGELRISNVTVNAEGTIIGVSANGDFYIIDSTVISNGNVFGIQAYEKNLKIVNSNVICSTKERYAIDARTTEIENSTVSASGKVGMNVQEIKISKGSKVTASCIASEKVSCYDSTIVVDSKNDYGLSVCDLTIDGGMLSVTVGEDAEGYAVMAMPNGIHIGENMMIVTPENGKLSDDMSTIVDSDGKPAKMVVIKQSHKVTVTAGDNGKASASAASGAEGTTITLIATPDEGYVFKEWQVVKGGVKLKDPKSAETTFTMGTADVEIKAVFAAKPTPAPQVTLKLDKKSASVICGNTTTIKATLTGSKDKITWKSSDTKIATVDANGKVTTKMAGTVTITASAAGKKATCTVTVLYKDVTDSKEFWYAPTNYLTKNGIVKGYDNQTLFKPSKECSRAQMVTFLWRLAGQPNPKKTTTDFKDIKTTDYFYKPVLWAVEMGITTGVSKTSFNPQGICTRAQTVTFLWRMAGKPAPKSKDCKFTDIDSKDYFYKATLWASEMKIVAGYDDNTFRPQGKCLRRQMVTFLYKYDKYVNGKG